MPNYNFTVRATDDLNLKSDRDFSITVNNTSVDEVVYVGTNGLARSPDGLTWRSQAGNELKGISIVWAGDRWIKITELGALSAPYTGTLNVIFHESFDAITWNTINYAPGSFATLNANEGANTNPLINGSLSYLNNTLYFVAYNVLTTGSAKITLFISTDKGLTWTARPLMTNANLGSSTTFHSIWRKLISNGTSGDLFFAIAPYNGSINYGAVTATATAFEVLTLRSIDNGVTWTPSKYAANLNSATIVDLQYLAGNYTVFCSQFSGSFFYDYSIAKSADGLSAWSVTSGRAFNASIGGVPGDACFGTPAYLNGVLFYPSIPAGSFGSTATLDLSAFTMVGRFSNLLSLNAVGSSPRFTGGGRVSYGAYLNEVLGNRLISCEVGAGSLPDTMQFVGGSLPITSSWFLSETPTLAGAFNAGILLSSAVRI